MRTKKNYYLKLSFLKRTENSNYLYDFKAKLANMKMIEKQTQNRKVMIVFRCDKGLFIHKF